MKSENQLNREKKVGKFMKMGCLSFIIIIAVVVTIGAVVGVSSSDKTSAAYIVSKEFVKSHLDFPEEAEFPLMPVMSDIQEDTDSLYRVVGEVTFPNSFGVKSKKRYILRMKYLGGEELNPRSWKVVDFNFPNI